MTTHLYITKIESFTSEQPAVEFRTYDGSKISPPTMLDGERYVVSPSMSHEVIRSTRFSQYALDKHGRKTVVNVSLGLSQEVETALSLYIDNNRQLQEDNASLLEDNDRLKHERDSYSKVYTAIMNASFWQRLKWVFTGVRL